MNSRVVRGAVIGIKATPASRRRREGWQYMEMAPRLVMWSGLALTLVVYCLNMVGDATCSTRGCADSRPSAITPPVRETER